MRNNREAHTILDKSPGYDLHQKFAALGLSIHGCLSQTPTLNWSLSKWRKLSFIPGRMFPLKCTRSASSRS
ncbi:hypothetical protein MCP1_10154 [Candidatus Terasakiella magnetica]|nr:hypothetical protein MCP1_10154 [Candidatus Terasakiella magnetica]